MCQITENHRPTPVVHFGGYVVEAAMVRFLCGLFLAALFVMLGVLRWPMAEHPLDVFYPQTGVRFVEVENSRALEEQLRRLGLWELEGKRQVVPVVFNSLPDDMGQLRAETRKRLFLHALVPTALVALAEVERERTELLRLGDRLAAGPCELAELLAGEVGAEQCGLTAAEGDFLVALSAKYRSRQLAGLRQRVAGLPLSLILAQAAIESSWGTSRFAREGGNLFGIWTWDGSGMVPADRAAGKTHRVAEHGTTLESVRSYLLMINRVGAYRTLREIRRETMDSLELIKGLRYYSEKRGRYVDDLERLIRGNRLQRLDKLTLDRTLLRW
ncbi:MAG: glucosaminidase domain-containing protein [Desulfurivibrio sp.]|nr:glucosaminidase domain-containing protein [Desulfurivibrio sp.]